MGVRRVHCLHCGILSHEVAKRIIGNLVSEVAKIIQILSPRFEKDSIRILPKVLLSPKLQKESVGMLSKRWQKELEYCL